MAVTIQNRPPKYLVCVDERPESRVALRLACAKAVVRGGRVEILHVLLPADFQSLNAVADLMREEQRADAEALLQRLSAEAYETYGIMPSVSLRDGQIGEAIVTAATEDYDASMLVLGVAEQGSGRGGLVSWLANQLGARLVIPLLLVPG
ncbi:MAG: universal stress protein, partial [Alphaproteobacteria bacterium]|nr:universal stress protein [Alphaproteobacteria bacterium]